MNGKKYHRADGEYGAGGEAFIRQYIKNNGYTPIKHPNGIYAEDIEYKSDYERFYVDVERATERRWSGRYWLNWPTIHVLARRAVAEEILFFTVSADMTKAYVSFPRDLMKVKPIPMDNIHAEGEMTRDHEIMRCLCLDLTKPIYGSIAEMNANRVRKIVRESDSYTEIVRTLRGVDGGPGYEAPYGIDDDDYRQLLLDLEDRSGIKHFVGRRSGASSQATLF